MAVQRRLGSVQLSLSRAHPAAGADAPPLHYLSIAEAAERFAEGSLTSPELLDALFSRIDATEPKTNSFVLQTRAEAYQQAVASAERWAAGRALGPMDGIPIGLKDIFDTAGVVTASGCHGLRERVPSEDAHSVALLRAAGAVFLGKTYTVEFASAGLINPAYRPEVCSNPHDTGRQPGGSSSGTGTSVACGQAMGGTGSCTGGSIRGPASWCGLTGHKPTYGLVSKRGVTKLSMTLDHAGPMCRSALDCAIFLDAIAGHDPFDPCSGTAPDSGQHATGYAAHVAAAAAVPAGTILVCVPSMLDGCKDDVVASFEAALAVLRQLGCEIVEAEPLEGRADLDPDDVFKNICECMPLGLFLGCSLSRQPARN
jgi:aspartyl-tRNA(Asn)/glutamyl-tRNA(Gln) amidotransferase subunit A